jgi:DNA-binding MurR/RpiR family transcriptional regulator
MGLSPSHQAVADYLERKPEAILNTAAEVGRHAGVNASTVVRYAKASGYSGWTEMQQVQRSLYLAGLNATDTQRTHSAQSGNDSPFKRSVQQDLTNVRRVQDAIPQGSIDDVVERLVGAKRILVAASGSYVAPAVVLSHLGSVIGLPMQMEDRSGVNLAAAIAHLSSDDCLVAVNLWRQTTDLVSASKFAQDRGVPVIAITDTRMGIAEHANHILLVPSESTSFFQSTSAAVTVVYGLIAELSEAMGASADTALQQTQQAWDEMQSLGPLHNHPTTSGS